MDEQQTLRRVMPNNPEAEKAVLSSMLMDRNAIITAAGLLKASDFYHQQYGIVFEVICELFNEGKAVDMVTVQDRLREKDVPPEVGSVSFMMDLMSYVPNSSQVADHAAIVYEKSVMRQLIRTTESIANDCYAGHTPLENILQRTEEDVFSILMSRNTEENVSIMDITMNVISSIEAASKSNSSVTGVPTGFRDLDMKTLGLQKTDLVLVAARPSMGKTAFVLNLAHFMAVKHDYNVAIFSLEMSKEQLVNRMLSMDSGVNSDKLRSGKLTDPDWISLVDSANVMSKSHLIIDETPSISFSQLAAKCRKLSLEKRLDIVIIDYLQLMSGNGGKNDSRQEEVAKISRSLKGLARELKVPVVALSQLSRNCESRPDKRPMLSDLRDSGAIEQDADVVMFLYRDDYYHKDSDKKNVGEVIIAKQRNGALGTVELAWIPERTKFADLEKTYQQGL